jgi:hypothetical protein
VFKTIALGASGFAAGVLMTVATLGVGVRPAGADQAEHAYLVAQKAQVAGTTFQLDKSGFHEIAVSAAEGRIAAGALGTVRPARIAAQATEWPEALKPMAAGLVADLQALEEAIRTDDASKVAEPAKKVHDVSHDLSVAVYTWLGGGQPAGGSGH